LQVGVVSSAQLSIHDHGDMSSGGFDNTLVRVASANLKINNATLRTSLADAFTLIKRVIFLGASTGSLRCSFRMQSTGGAGTVHGQVRMYRGATNLFTGVDNSTAAGPTIYTETPVAVDIQALDVIDIWGYSVAGVATLNIDNMQVLYDTTLTALSRMTLAAPLALSAASDIPYTIVS